MFGHVVYRHRDAAGRVVSRCCGEVVVSGVARDSEPVLVAAYWHGGERRLAVWPRRDCVSLTEWFAEPRETRDVDAVAVAATDALLSTAERVRPLYWISSDSLEDAT